MVWVQLFDRLVSASPLVGLVGLALFYLYKVVITRTVLGSKPVENNQDVTVKAGGVHIEVKASTDTARALPDVAVKQDDNGQPAKR